MKTIYDQIKDELESNPFGRCRRNKDAFIISLLLKNLSIYSGESTMRLDLLPDFVHDFQSYDRLWRKVLSENAHLRGPDYSTKDKVEQRAEIALGYEAGYHEDVKKLQNVQ